MGKKHKNLFDRICAEGNIQEAYRKASLGKKHTRGFLAFKEYERLNLDKIRDELTSLTYLQGPHTVFEIREPKRRTISALPFRDRVVQHALCAVIGPIFEAGMLPSSHACRKGKGTHSGARQCQAHIRQVTEGHGRAYVLKTDFSGYFYNIDRSLLWPMVGAKISCTKTLWLIGVFLPKTGKGIPIGNLTSQLFANVFGSAVDRYLAQTLRVKRFVRYMDDIVIIHHDMCELLRTKSALEEYCRDVLLLVFSKAYVKPCSGGVDFLGYRIFERYKLLRRDSVTRARRKIKRYTKSGDVVALVKFFSAFGAHARHADAHNLLGHLVEYQRRTACSLNTN